MLFRTYPINIADFQYRSNNTFLFWAANIPIMSYMIPFNQINANCELDRG